MGEETNIKSSTPNTARTSGTQSTQSTEEASNPESDRAASSSPDSGDVTSGLESAHQSKNELDRATGGRSEPGTTGASRSGSPQSAHELRASRADSDSGIEPWREKQAFRQLGQNIAVADSVDELRSELHIGNLVSDMSVEDLGALRQSPEKLRTFIRRKIAEHHDARGNYNFDPTDGFHETRNEMIQRTTDRIVGEIEDEFMADFKIEVHDEAVSQVQDSINLTKSLNRSPRARRRFLANVTASLDSRRQIQKTLVSQGLSKEDASSIARTLSELDREGAGLDTFLDGAKSPPKLDRAAGLLKTNFDAAVSGLRSFESRIKNDRVSNDQLLHDGNYAGARAAVLDDLGLDPALAAGKASAVDSELGEFVAEETSDAESAAEAEQTFNTGVQMAASVAVGVLTGPGTSVAAATGIGTGILNNAESLASAGHEVTVTRAARQAGLAAPGELDAAREGWDDAVTCAVVDVLFLGASVGSEASSEADDALNIVEEGAKTVRDETLKRIAQERDEALRRALED